MKVAVAGCCHGQLDKVFATLEHMERVEGVHVDLLLCCGDFQAARDETDLQCMAVPAKYRHMHSFHKYYSGAQKAPVLTIFIGGNHEASNHLQEIPYGGWVAPNIYYLGYAGIVKYGSLRIGGLSGIYNVHNYCKGHYEFPPYNNDTVRSVYHVRSCDVIKLKQIQQPLDVFLSHDWPRGIYNYGQREELLRRKRFLRNEVEANSLGSPAGAQLLHHLRPTFCRGLVMPNPRLQNSWPWTSAYLREISCRLAEHAVTKIHAKHETFTTLQTKKYKVTSQSVFMTKFSRIVVCNQVVEMLHDPEVPLQLEYDSEWLAILKTMDHLINVSPEIHAPSLKTENHLRHNYTLTKEAIATALSSLGRDLRVPQNFAKTVPDYGPHKPRAQDPKHAVNPQTTVFCAALGIRDPNVVLNPELSTVLKEPHTGIVGKSVNNMEMHDQKSELESRDGKVCECVCLKQQSGIICSTNEDANDILGESPPRA
ncbi:lariat debranching enzyme-like isoform X1 [Lethenteron reissneri]|uniref:lariat debranching enzyme-like isoform X1 n=1 Tax=Lethenteron reissneri TaxID=7753 RepID=UPI002AB78F35|nr:lariat debranching enzyme-like isoform X1 [Lethenteron reissneri]